MEVMQVNFSFISLMDLHIAVPKMLYKHDITLIPHFRSRKMVQGGGISIQRYATNE